MKGKEIIEYIVRGEVPDTEQVLQDIHQELDSTFERQPARKQITSSLSKRNTPIWVKCGATVVMAFLFILFMSFISNISNPTQPIDTSDSGISHTATAVQQPKKSDFILLAYAAEASTNKTDPSDITENISEPKTEKVSEPVSEPKTEKVSEPISEPVSEPISDNVLIDDYKTEIKHGVSGFVSMFSIWVKNADGNLKERYILRLEPGSLDVEKFSVTSVENATAFAWSSVLESEDEAILQPDYKISIDDNSQKDVLVNITDSLGISTEGAQPAKVMLEVTYTYGVTESHIVTIIPYKESNGFTTFEIVLE